MSQPAVFQGTFSDFRIVKGRKVVQIMVEVPSEQANAALAALGGLPDPANPAWVAVARLDAKQAEQPKQLAAPERKKWEDMPPAQKAAIRCAEPEFWRFLGETICKPRDWNAPTNSEEAAQVVRHLCQVDSRARLNVNAPAREAWLHLDSEYWAWQRGLR
jgi:hypothetical protein